MLITIDGQLSGEYVEFVEAWCEQASASGKPVHLLLQDVRLVDEAGLRLLSCLAASGVRLRANGVYNSHLIRECESGLRRCNTKPPSHAEDPV